MDDLLGELEEVEDLLEDQKQEGKKKSFKSCLHCLKKIKKKSYTKHLIIKHFHHCSEISMRRIFSLYFIKNTDKIIQDLQIIKEILNTKIDIQIKKKNKLKKKIWYNKYRDNLKELKLLLKKNQIDNDNAGHNDDNNEQ